jgi:hypothetical protein
MNIDGDSLNLPIRQQARYKTDGYGELKMLEVVF